MRCSRTGLCPEPSHKWHRSSTGKNISRTSPSKPKSRITRVLTLLIIEVGPWSIINVVRRRPGSCELSTSLPTQRNQEYFRLTKSTSTQTRNCKSCPLVISQLTVILNDEQIQLISSWIGLATFWGTASITRSSLSGMFPSLERRLCSKRPI